MTFGWKTASWADEIRRHLDRIRAGASRWLVGQLGGGVGSLVFYGEQGLAVRARFCAELGLADPGISWLSARDRGAELAQLLALICGTLARIGGEIYELQRPEIGELAEASPAGTVGSITMPHKRNPEASEHLDTLARLARANAAVMVEAVVQQHERDGRGWKAEWSALPEVCLLATAALQVTIGLLAGLDLDGEAMRRNLARRGRPGRGAGARDRWPAAPGAGKGLDRGARHRLVPGDDRPCGRPSPGRESGGTTGVAGMTAASPARTRLATLPTPLVAAPRLAQVMGTGPLYLKRDDLTGFAIGGNKARPLEFLVAAAVTDRADTLVTGGAPSSNFCAAVAAAALWAGLRCELVLAGQPPSLPGPALALALSWGATVRWTGSAERDSVDDQLPRAAAALSSSGHRPYLIPRGGASGLGAIGYALAAFELQEQLAAIGVAAVRVVVAVGSGGTLAGLVAGNVLLGRPWTLVGGSVSRPVGDAAPRVLALARECALLMAEAGVLDQGGGHDGSSTPFGV